MLAQTRIKEQGMRLRIFCALLVFMVLTGVVGCNKTKSSSRSIFESLNGDYALPIAYSTEAVVDGIGGTDVIWDFVRRHSDQKLWTYVLKPQNQVNSLTGKVEVPKVGWDKFMRLFGEHLAQLQIIWSPKEYQDLTADFHDSIKLHKQNDIWIDGSEQNILIDGHKGMSGRFKVTLPDKKMYATFAVVHVGDRRYQIQLSYTDGFTDPDNTFDKVMKIEFRKPAGQESSNNGV
jgi:hypothetical protein